MTGIPSVSPDSLKTRRQALESQRRWKFWQSVWRFLAIAGLAGGAFWLMFLPEWTIRESRQVEIEGNRLLSAKQVRGLLSLSYPQSVWRLPAQQLSERLQGTPPIAAARVTRQLLPPKVTVTVWERQPVAVAPSSRGGGFLDAQGVWIPQSFYQEADKTWQPPALQVLGYEATHRPYWQEIYPLLKNSAVKISAVDWRNPQNLILKTELGTAYFGAYTPDFSQKLDELAQMRPLNSRIPPSRLVYIDLTNGAAPTVQVKPEKLEEKAPGSVRD